MIIVTHRFRSSDTPPVIVRGGERARRDLSVMTDVVRNGGSWSIAERLRAKVEAYRNVERFLYVDPGAVVHPPCETLEQGHWDIAAYVHSIGTRPTAPRPFAGVGRIDLSTLGVRRTDASRRVLDRWATRTAARPGSSPAVELAIALTEIPEARLLHLPPEYICGVGVNRTLGVRPVVEHRSRDTETVAAPPSPKPQVHTPREPEVLYSSHLRDYSGYAKASRNVLFRISNSIRTRVDNSEIAQERVIVDLDTNRRIDAYTQTLVSDRAPLFRFYTPKQEVRKAPRICMTMMETQTLSPEFSKLLNENYSEVLVPTSWNKDVFRDGGVRIPISVVPLGYDPIVYAPGPKTPKPKAMLLTTSRAGRIESPTGYTFMMVFQPTFRKGIDHLVAAFEQAFSGHPSDASLVLVTSIHGKLDQYGCAPFSRLKRGAPRSAKSRIYHLTGTWNEWEMAKLYRSFDCYVAASGAEGWDLPMCEATACGLPLIATKCSSHSELLDATGAWTYAPDGYATVPGSEQVSVFYGGQKFAVFGADAVERLKELLRKAPAALRRSTRGRVVRIDHTWDKTADAVSRKIIEANEL